MAGTAVTDMADTTGSADASPADLFLTESEASDVAQKPVPIVPPPAAASGRPAEAGSRIAADSQAVNTAKAAAFRRPSIASAAQLAAGRHRQASGVFRGFRLQQPGCRRPSGSISSSGCPWACCRSFMLMVQQYAVYRPSTSVSTSHVGPICLWATFSSLDWRYLAFKGLIRVPWDIYLRFRGLVAKYERLQNGMVPMAIGAQYSRYHVSAPPRNVDRCFAAVESTPRNADSVGS